MTDLTIKPIGSAQQTETSGYSKTQALEQTLNRVPSTNASVENENASGEARSLANVSIQFRVDEKTKDVTVFLVDRKSKKVLRSIPASELSKLQISDLLKMTV